MRGNTPSRTASVACIVIAFLRVGSVCTASSGEPPTSFGVEVHGAGSPVLLIPGLGCNGEVWDETVLALEDRYEIHVLSLSGFAGRAAIEAPFLPRVREEIVAYIRAQELERHAIIGHSLGGFMAFWLAASEPTLVGAIIAVDGVPFLPGLMDADATAESVRPMAESMKAMMDSLTPEQFALQTRMSLSRMVTASDDLERLALQGAASDQATVAQAMFELMTTDLRGVVGSIETPVMLIAATALSPTPEDRSRLRRSYEAQVAPIPDHRVVLADRARHFVMLDAREFFEATVAGFLAEVAGEREGL
ncbi:MAG: alpha/beta hydrolase [Acidobacteria bacterium]|nr:alpha/beta hydrolase [Acidobacteriota bacterium]